MVIEKLTEKTTAETSTAARALATNLSKSWLATVRKGTIEMVTAPWRSQPA